MIAGSIVAVHDLDTRVERKPWPWAEANRAAIAAHWQRLVAEKPALYNGVVLMAERPRIEDGIYRSIYFPVEYASLIAWRDFGWPDPSVSNGFAMAALRGADGAFIAGIMGAHTANARAIYFAAGTPDLDDVRPDGSLDLAGSVLRELGEETGVRPGEVEVRPEWTAIVEPARVALMREVISPLPAADLAARIEAFLAREIEPELSGVHVIRTAADILPGRMPDFMVTYLRSVLPA